MSDQTVTPIRPDLAPLIEARAEAIRELLFQAQAIVNVAAAAAKSYVPADDWSTRNTLKAVSKLLDDATGLLEPGVITGRYQP